METTKGRKWHEKTAFDGRFLGFPWFWPSPFTSWVKVSQTVFFCVAPTDRDGLLGSTHSVLFVVSESMAGCTYIIASFPLSIDVGVNPFTICL